MSVDNNTAPAHGRPRRRSLPRAVDQLAGEPEWTVIRRPSSGRWATAEWQGERGAISGGSA